MSAAGSGGFSREFALFSGKMVLFWLILGEGGILEVFLLRRRGKWGNFLFGEEGEIRGF